MPRPCAGELHDKSDRNPAMPRPCAGEVHADCYKEAAACSRMPRPCAGESHDTCYSHCQRETPRHKVAASRRKPRLFVATNVKLRDARSRHRDCSCVREAPRHRGIISILLRRSIKLNLRQACFIQIHCQRHRLARKVVKILAKLWAGQIAVTANVGARLPQAFYFGL